MLTAHEKETIVLFNEAEDMASVFTYNKRWQTHLEQMLRLKATETNSFGGKEYRLPKKWLKLPRAPRKLSEEQRKQLKARLHKPGQGQRQNAYSGSKTPSAQEVFKRKGG